MADLSQAVQDLIWLSNRFQGLVELKDTLSTYTSLQNQIAELTHTTESLKSDVSNLLTNKANVEADINKLKSDGEASVKEASVKYERILLEAITQANQLKEDASKEIEQSKLDAKADLDALSYQKTELQSQLNATNVEIAKASETLQSLRNELNTLKNKF